MSEHPRLHGESVLPVSDAEALEALTRRLDVLAWNLPRPRGELYLPAEEVWPEHERGGRDDPLLPPAA